MEWLKRKFGFTSSEERGKKGRFEEPKTETKQGIEEDFVQVNLPESTSNPIMQPVENPIDSADRIGLAAIPQLEAQSTTNDSASNQSSKKQSKQSHINPQPLTTKQPKKPPRTPQNIIHQPK